ncbi:MAG: hypothetical protein ABMB14_22485 [Myxococcota bacterium]
MRTSPCLPLLLLVLAPAALANTAIETETAQIGEQGEIGTSNSVEIERAKDGYALGTLTQFEYGITDHSEILIEPFFYQAELPDLGGNVHGSGDLEISPSYEFITEKGARPAVLLAFKLKVPVGAVPDFSTGKFDYYPYFIFGKHVAGLTFNANLGVNFTTPVRSTDKVGETVVWDLEVERNIGGKKGDNAGEDTNAPVTVFAEVFSAEEGIFTASAAFQVNPTPKIGIFVASSYDVEGSFVVRPGINFDFY